MQREPDITPLEDDLVSRLLAKPAHIRDCILLSDRRVVDALAMAERVDYSTFQRWVMQ